MKTKCPKRARKRNFMDTSTGISETESRGNDWTEEFIYLHVEHPVRESGFPGR